MRPVSSFLWRGLSTILVGLSLVTAGCGGAIDSGSNTSTTPTSQTISFSNPGAQTVGTPLTLSATATSGLAVSFASTTQTICTVSGTTATFIAAGNCTIQATQAGNSAYSAATAVSQSFAVNVAPLKSQTISFSNPGAQTVGTPLTLQATATSGLAVSFASTTQTICTVSGTTATFIAAGNCTIQATQAGNSTYAAAPSVSQSFVVNVPAVSGLSGPDINVFRPTWTPAHAYYVDANLGNDSNNGTSAATAWKTLGAIHNKVLGPGDVVYLARGSVWTNQQILLDNNSAGSAQMPVVFEAYGTGAAPTISAPYALWSTPTDPIPFTGVVFGPGSSYITVLDLLIQNVANDQGAVSMDENSNNLIFAGNEISVAGTGITLNGQHQKMISNNIHDIGSSGGSSGICVGVVGKDLEIGWNRLERCVVQTADGPDGGAFEFFGYQSDVGFNYVSDDIRIHHNQIDSCYDFMESYGVVTNELIAYNTYTNSNIEALEFHFDHGWGDTESHVLSYDVRIENNTFMPTLTSNPGGWGTIGLLMDSNTANNSDPTQSHISFRNNIFVTNYKIIANGAPESSVTHDHNIFWFSGSGAFDDSGNINVTSTEKLANPLFVDADYASLDLDLQSGSPAIGAGVNLGYAEDIAQTAVPTTSAPDIGAYQHKATLSSAAPTITDISPNFAVAGSAAQTVLVTGTEFLPTTTATFGGVAHTPTNISATSLTLPLTAADLATVKSTTVVLTNPAPGGGSASADFSVITSENAMTDLSQYAAGNQARLQNLIAKARSGQKITIAAIGGSITEGSAASSASKRYINLFQTWWNTQFTGGSTLVNAGIGATDSDYGSLRVQRDVLSKTPTPDLVIVEFAVNDLGGGVTGLGDTYEGLVRQLLDAPSHPAVILLFMMTYPQTISQPTLEEYYTAEPWQSAIGANYSVPMVSYADAIFPEIMNGTIALASITPDYTHPTDLGHAYIAQFLEQSITDAMNNFPAGTNAAPIPATPAALHSSDFEFTSLVDGATLNPTSNSGWVAKAAGTDGTNGNPDAGLESSTPGSTLDFSVSGSEILVGYWVYDGAFGQVSVTVDGDASTSTVLDGWADQTWGGSRGLTRVASGLTSGAHTVHIKLLSTKDSGSTGYTFRLLCVGAGGVPQS